MGRVIFPVLAAYFDISVCGVGGAVTSSVIVIRGGRWCGQIPIISHFSIEQKSISILLYMSFYISQCEG